MRNSGFGWVSLVVGVALCAGQSGSAWGATVAYWRFEEGPADSNVLHGGLAGGAFFPGAADSSGNDYHLSAWTEGGCCGFAFRTDLANGTITQTGAPNNFSVQNTGSFPALFTDTAAAIRTITPAAFTIEASFKPETGGHRTIVGRDSRGATPSVNNDLAALYFQIVPGDAVAIKFADVSGFWHEAVSDPGAVQGFAFPNAAAGHWYHMAAVSDGSTLTLYLKDVDAGTGYELVAETDLTASGSPNTALSAGTGDGGDWDAGNWSVGRGLYAGGHTDRGFGFIDEVRISDTALDPSQFLFSVPPGTSVVLSPETLYAAPYDPPRVVNLIVPPVCNADQPIDVTITSDNPASAKPAGSDGSTVVSYAAGDGATKQVSLEFGVAGQAHLTLAATGDCPADPGPALTVTVYAAQAVELQITYPEMTVGGTQQATVVGNFAAAGTRDITVGAMGTTYAADPAGIVDIGADGLITAQATGSVEITALNNGVSSPPVTITVGPAPAIAVAGPGVLLVDLRASDPTAGSGTWRNLGVLDDFVSLGNPVLALVGGESAVTFEAIGDGYQGPLAPSALRTGAGWTVETWVYNPSIDWGMETMVAWGHRNGPDGTNVSFGCGNNSNWGALAAWGAPDLGWGAEPTGAPPVGQWLHLVYTYSHDPGTNTSIVRVYDNGVEMNAETTNFQLIPHPGTINLCTQNLTDPPSDFFMEEWGMLSFANVRFHAGALTPAQVAQNFAAGIQEVVVEELTFAPRAISAAVIDADMAVNVAIPPACTAGQNLAVTVTSSDPLVATPAGSPGSTVLNFPANGVTSQTLPIDFVGPGQADFTLSADKPCAVGPVSTLHVDVYAAASIDLQVTYDLVTVGAVQTARVMADFGPAGQRDVTAASWGTTYEVAPADVVEVSMDGQITALALGEATLTAYYSGFVAQRAIKVTTPGHPRLKIAGSGLLLVDLSAQDVSAGQGIWVNKGALGDFTAVGAPTLASVGGELAVSFGGADAYQGPPAPPELLGGQGRTIEVWAYNPAIECSACIETMVSWGHRGGPCGSNLAFGFGDHATWGGVAGWCDNGDLGWNDAGGSPPLAQWRYLVYTYNPAENGGTTRLYDNGVLSNQEVSGSMPTHPGHINLVVQNLSVKPMDLFLTAEMGTLSLAAVRVHGGVLAPEEIEFNYRAGITGLGQIPPDLNLDTYVDAQDLVIFRACAGGPDVPLSEDCRIIDFDQDGDGDQVDFGIFQRCYAGPTVPASANCMQ